MQKPAPKDVQDALSYARKDKAVRGEHETWFLKQFAQRYLTPDEGMDPTAHAAALAQVEGLGEISQRLVREGTMKYVWPEPAAPEVYGLDESAQPALPRAQEVEDELVSFARAELGEDEDKGSKVKRNAEPDEEPEPGLRAKTVPGMAIEAEVRRGGGDSAVDALLYSSDTERTGRRARKVMQWTARLTLAAGGAVAAYTGLRTGEVAQDIGKGVEGHHQKIGDAFGNIHNDPFNTKIPGTGEPGQKELKGKQPSGQKGR